VAAVLVGVNGLATLDPSLDVVNPSGTAKTRELLKLAQIGARLRSDADERRAWIAAGID